MRTLYLTPLLALGLTAIDSLGQSRVGDPLPAAKLEGFTLTQATSLDDYVGRALLIEFFAHW